MLYGFQGSYQIFQIQNDTDDEIYAKYINHEGEEVEDEKINHFLIIGGALTLLRKGKSYV